MSLDRLAADMDPRLKAGLGFAVGLLVWRAGPAGVGLYLLASLLLFWALRHRLPSSPGAARAYVVFVVLWALVKAGGDLLGGVDWVHALAAGGGLGMRLAVLVFVGLALAASTSARQLGLAVSWACAPVLRSRAWQAGLAVGLCVHYLPLVWREVGLARDCAKLRLAGKSRLVRMGTAARAASRSLAARTQTQALAVALRNMDDARAWSMGSRPTFCQAGTFLVLLGLMAGAAYL